MSIFDNYARYYDLLYRDKDYAGEAAFVHLALRAHQRRARSLLDLGCGTGRHAIEFARLGWKVSGIDLSGKMVAQASERSAALSAPLARRLEFGPGDVRTVRKGRTFDAVISLFHVMSYQSSHTDLCAAIVTAATHLEPGGLFFFDFWHGSAVLSDPPTTRVRRLEDADVRVTRVAEPVVDYVANVVTVHYEILVENKRTHTLSRFQEEHHVRYLFFPELENMLQTGGFELIEVGPWLQRRRPDKDHWFVWALARKKN